MDNGAISTRLNHLDKCLDEHKEDSEKFRQFVRKDLAELRDAINDMKVSNARQTGIFIALVAAIQFFMGSGWASLARLLGPHQ